jgi:hypothetical protein
MDGMESFKPDPRNKAAQDEWKEGVLMHNEGLHDEEGSKGINEATGVRDKTKAVDGEDETLSHRQMSMDDASDDVMGSLPDTLPDDPAALAKWLEKEKARLEKKKGFKKAA